YRLYNIEQILLTHGHVDHTGQAVLFTESRMHNPEHEVQFGIHSSDWERVARFEEFIEGRVESYFRIIGMGAVPLSARPPMPADILAKYFKSFGESVPQVSAFQEGDCFPTGIGNLEVLSVPGHSSGSSCFVCNDAGLLFSGDHLLATISSNPSLDFELEGQIPLLTYLDSLDKIAKYNGMIAFPGHRGVIKDIEQRAEDLKSEYNEKLRQTEDALGFGPKTLYELSRIIYGNYNSDSLVLALAETRDLLRVLEFKGKASLENENGVLRAFFAE
ncbi:MAG: MBL fold metallo-hydrolase, partial [Candidatus Hodarchaeota archaeon]